MKEILTEKVINKYKKHKIKKQDISLFLAIFNDYKNLNIHFKLYFTPKKKV